ncbi:fam-a protein [Plasmodium chabaudi chabaudi]|uniref:Fam-a protein n=1 Tax=Plasmodium chabaudi chabaudi TaxID=31271 RepID=A0A4V0K2P7_PLACU|nr:fam-a protein [Plasmodium chabaudi chabaudi]VTZ67123.1 fam-a protein [Plasmodium chabaudi chabaudi]|eukprot:XP_016652944.1 fam-a protein [Plasmodium chabaudi chabaudi]
MNKVYIKIALALLSLAGYMENVAFASETATNSDIHSSALHQNDESEQYKDLTCEDIDESLLAIEHISDTSELLLKLTENMDGYSLDSTENENKHIYSKKIGNIDIGRLHVTIPSSSKYASVLRSLWDYNDPKKTNNKFISGNVVRVYCKYAIMFEKQNIDPIYKSLVKKYALGASVKQSNDTTVIVCPSRILNYLGEINDEPNMKEILENTQSIEKDINAEEALTKLSNNIAGFVIKKHDDSVEVTYINAIYEHDNSAMDKKERDITYTNILSLAQHI